MKSKLISQGAEAKIYLKDNLVTKDRISKSYRHPELDKQIRKRRTKSETKLLTKAAQIINSPIPEISKDFDKIKMPFIKGKKLSEHLNKFPLKQQKEICKEIGTSIAKLHKAEIIHGDLTTSNMILKKDKIYFIDFGLGFISRKIEDKAVDLHLFKQALEAKHFENYKILIKEVFKEYEKELGKTEANKIFERIVSVERRGRYRH
jgi:TP53 regulating kinase-like protein